tara:strand:- start:276 stop:2111 length:1836 start_codon:yes stop_codon:yes gene_type:complete
MSEEIEDLFKTTQGSNHIRLSSKPQYTNEEIGLIDELIEIVLNANIKFKIHPLLNKLSKKHKISYKMRTFKINYMIRNYVSSGKLNYKQLQKLNEYLKVKKMRSESGILEIAIVTSPGSFSCAFNCYYCPNQPGYPRSYVKNGPSLLRAQANNFDIVKQFYDRGGTYAVNFHNVDKVEVILLGGTWDSYGLDYQEKTITEVYYAANTFYSIEPREMRSMDEEKKLNETALCKIVGITIETRPDQITPEQLRRCLNYGVTRIQIGVQHTNNKILKKINRGCTIEDVYEACYLIKEANIKLLTHWMPNLPGSCPDLDIEMFDELLNNPLLRCDDVKIYPTIVTSTSDRDDSEVYTEIEKWFKEGKYVPYDNEIVKDVIIYYKTNVGEDVRISRVFRDIPKQNIVGGADEPNMRQILHNTMDERGLSCNCIRCHEVKTAEVEIENVTIRVKKMEANRSIEYFISAVSYDKMGKRLVHGFIRLRLPHINNNHFIEELENCALIREVHVYGELIPCFNLNKNYVVNDEIKGYLNSLKNNQHRGIGKKLVAKAEEISLSHGYKQYAIISGVGVREYYRSQGYELEGAYMIKTIGTIEYDLIYSFIIIIITILLIIYG